VLNEVQQNRRREFFSEGARGNLFFAKKWFHRKLVEKFFERNHNQKLERRARTVASVTPGGFSK